MSRLLESTVLTMLMLGSLAFSTDSTPQSGNAALDPFIFGSFDKGLAVYAVANQLGFFAEQNLNVTFSLVNGDCPHCFSLRDI